MTKTLIPAENSKTKWITPKLCQKSDYTTTLDKVTSPNLIDWYFNMAIYTIPVNILSISSLTLGACPHGWVEYPVDQSCYLISNTLKTWRDAQVCF